MTELTLLNPAATPTDLPDTVKKKNVKNLSGNRLQVDVLFLTVCYLADQKSNHAYTLSL